MYERWQRKHLEDALRKRRVIIVAGSRQCGKTTLARQLEGSGAAFYTLDDIMLQRAAAEDPHGFVARGDKRLIIIDEIQHNPELLYAIKKAVDEDTSPGQYLLTGSANIQSLPGVKESLAGRVHKIKLHPLAQGEIEGSSPCFLENCFSEQLRISVEAEERGKILEYAFRGGYPEVLGCSGEDRRSWHHDYTESLLERDLKDIINLRRKDTMTELLNVLAAWSGKYMNVTDIASKLQVSRATVETYINALETLYLFRRVPSWSKTDYDRVNKQPKLYIEDSGLMASILNWSLKESALNADRTGKLVETFVFNQLMAQVDLERARYSLYQYRDRDKREIDFLVERSDGALLGIEVKSSTLASKDDFKHLLWFQQTLAGSNKFVGVVLYAGQYTVNFGKNLWAVPISMLWRG